MIRVTFMVVAAMAVAVSAQQPRDPAAMRVTGTSAIAGEVVTDDSSPRGIGRAIVTLSGDALGGRSAITDDNGRFAFANLPSGRYTISAAKPAYLPAAYGARRPGRPGTAIILAEGAAQQVTLRMARGAVIAGTIRDALGQPLSGVEVSAVSARNPEPPRASPFGANDAVTTDDRGEYRIFGLLPGDYLVRATLGPGHVAGQGSIGARPAADMDALLAALGRRASGQSTGLAAPAPQLRLPLAPTIGFLPTYFPGTFGPDDAEVIPLAAGDERSGVDFAVQPASAGEIAGTVDGVSNPSLIELSIYQVGAGSGSSSTNPILVERPSQSGSFRYTNITPGRYRLVARADRNRTAPPPMMGSGTGTSTSDFVYALAEVDISGGGTASVTLSLQPGSTISGSVSFDGATTPAPTDLGAIRVELRTPDRSFMSMSGGTVVGNGFQAGAYAYSRTDGSFAIRNVAPGQYRLVVTLPASLTSAWSLRSAAASGRDWLDGIVDVAVGSQSSLQVVVSDRRTELAGTLQAAAGTPAPDYFIVIFPADKALWSAARRVKSTRPANDGSFSVRDLPAGQYLLAALTDVEPADLADLKFLEQIAPAALRVTLAEGETTTQNVMLAR